MFLKNSITTSTKTYSAQIDRLKNEMESADAVVIGAGAGMSVSAGMAYDGERFKKHFADFHSKYGITDMYSGGFYPYNTLEECAEVLNITKSQVIHKGIELVKSEIDKK